MPEIPKYPNTSLKKYLAWVEESLGRGITDDEMPHYVQFYEFAQYGYSTLSRED